MSLSVVAIEEQVARHANHSADSAKLPVKNTFIHFEEQKTGSKSRTLRRCSTDPTEDCMPLPIIRPPPSLVQDELKEEEEEDASGMLTPCRSHAASSTTDGSSLPASPSPSGGAATPETPLGTPPFALPWAAVPAWPPRMLPASPPALITPCLGSSLPSQVSGFCSEYSYEYDAGTWQTSFSFTLRRADDVAMGLKGVVDRNGELLVESVAPGSALDSWNRFQVAGEHNDRSVRPGDRVISVNGLTWSQAMLQECEEKHLLKLEVVRGAPTFLPENCERACSLKVVYSSI